MLCALVLATLSQAPPDLAVLGIVVSPRPERAVAVLQSGGRTRIVGPGDTAFGGQVSAVTAKTILLRYGDEVVELRLPGGVPPVATPPPPRLPPPVPEDPATPARTMNRREVERRVGDEMQRLLAETTLVPVLDSGRVAGFALTRIPEGSLLTDAGLRAGDVLTQVNDVPIDNLGTLLALWPRLQTESELRAVVLRNGQPISLRITLR